MSNLIRYPIDAEYSLAQASISLKSIWTNHSAYNHREAMLKATSGLVRELGAPSVQATKFGDVSVEIIKKLFGAIERAEPGGFLPGEREQEKPIGTSLLFVRSEDMAFHGFILEDQIKFECEKRKYEVPINQIIRIDSCTYSGKPRIDLVNNSVNFYNTELIYPMKWRFATVLGIQTVEIKKVVYERTGGMGELFSFGTGRFEKTILPIFNKLTVRPVYAKRFAEELENILAKNLDQIYKIIGKEKVKKYFDTDDLEAAKKGVKYV